MAAALGQVDEVSRLVSDGRDPVSGLDGDTPLHAASGNGHGGVVAVLLNAGVHPDLRIAGACALSPFLPFSLSLFLPSFFALAVLRMTLSPATDCTAGLQLRAGDRTAMHTACEAGRDTVVATLLAGGADPEPVDSAGEKPRDLAERLGHAICA
eukprot:COSAG06_NODE_4384_length_4313_cov_1.652112_5_plen_154_part_00